MMGKLSVRLFVVVVTGAKAQHSGFSTRQKMELLFNPNRDSIL